MDSTTELRTLLTGADTPVCKDSTPLTAAEIESEVDDALGGGTGTALTAIPWNSNWDAEVQSEVDDGLVAQKLDHLVAVADADDVADNSIIAHMAASDGDWSGFDDATDALEALSGAGGGNITQIMGTALSETTGGNLAANFSTFWDDGDSQASAAKHSDIASILGDTNELQGDWTNGGRLDLIIDDILVDTGTTLDDFIDTEVAAIKAKTDNLPADPADDSDIDGQLATIDNYIDTEVADILTDTGTTLQNDIDGMQGTDGKALISTDAQDLSGTLDVNTKTFTAGSLANATFNADVGSTAYGTNIIALAARKVLDELNLDHLMKVAVSNSATIPEVVDDTVLANIMTKTDGDTSDFDFSTDSLEAIQDSASGNVTALMGTSLTETNAGDLAESFTFFFDVDPTTSKTVNDVGAVASGGGSELAINTGNLGDFKGDATVYFIWRTIDQGGAAVNPSTAGTVKVYKNDGTGEVSGTTGITDTRGFDSLTGIHLCAIDLTANSFYAKERDYSVVLTGATIDSQSVTAVIATFSIEKRYSEPQFIAF
jgi:hypothetical protein